MGPWHLLIVILVILLLFGGGRFAEIGKGLGEGIRNFKKGLGGPDEPRADDTKPAQEPALPKQLPGASGSEPSAEKAPEQSEKS